MDDEAPNAFPSDELAENRRHEVRINSIECRRPSGDSMRGRPDNELRLEERVPMG
jgi:hypothetical protein